MTKFFDCIEDVILLVGKWASNLEICQGIMSVIKVKFISFDAVIVTLVGLCLNFQGLEDVLHVIVTKPQLIHLLIALNGGHIGHKLTLRLSCRGNWRRERGLTLGNNFLTLRGKNVGEVYLLLIHMKVFALILYLLLFLPYIFIPTRQASAPIVFESISAINKLINDEWLTLQSNRRRWSRVEGT